MSLEIRKLAGELFGTFALVFAGTGAIVVNDVSHGTVTHVGIALTFGLIVLAAGLVSAPIQRQPASRSANQQPTG